MANIEDDYKLIPMSEITDEARKLAVAWMACEDKQWIGQKHKLASDIMNYARRYHEKEVKKFHKPPFSGSLLFCENCNEMTDHIPRQCKRCGQ